jgi:hypothetical protein
LSVLKIPAAEVFLPLLPPAHDKAAFGGRGALGRDHEKRDDARGIGLGLEHDRSSHDAGAFGLMCSACEPPRAALEQAVIVPNFGTVQGQFAQQIGGCGDCRLTTFRCAN